MERELESENGQAEGRVKDSLNENSEENLTIGKLVN